jgi:hypothetical protein
MELRGSDEVDVRPCMDGHEPRVYRDLTLPVAASEWVKSDRVECGTEGLARESLITARLVQISNEISVISSTKIA